MKSPRAVIQNQSGQAILEGTISIMLIVFFFVFILQRVNYLYAQIVVEDAIEFRMLCELTVEQNTGLNCTRPLERVIQKFKFKNVNLNFKKEEKKYTLQFSGNLDQELKINRELNIEKFKETF